MLYECMCQTTYQLLAILLATMGGPPGDLEADPLPPGAVARLGTSRWRMSDDTLFLGFGADGSQLVTVSQDNHWQVWDAATGKQVHRFGGIEHGCTNVALSPDGAVLATTNERGSVVLWDVVSGRKRGEIPVAPRSWPPEIVFAADGKSLFALDASQETSIKQWSTTTGEQLRRFDDPPSRSVLLARYGCHALLASADGRVLVSLHHDLPQAKKVLVALWDPQTGKRQRLVQGIGPT